MFFFSDIGGKSESSSEEETNKCGDSLETLELKENSVSDCVEDKTEVADAVAAASDDIDLSDVRKAIDDLESDTAPAENTAHLENTAPDTSIEDDTR